MAEGFSTVDLCGMEIARTSTDRVLDHLFDALEEGRGGWLITANIDFLRRYVKDPGSRALYDAADVRVADGMPLLWAASLRGTPLLERVAGSSLVLPLCQRAARAERSVYLLGGDPRAAEEAEARLREQAPGLRIAGRSSPWVSASPTGPELEPLRAELVRTAPDIVLVAFGSPKQERVIAALRAELPHAWWTGIGISLSFVAGHVERAPELVQNLGLEWVHRLVQEPRRLFKRYVVEDLPFAFELFGRVALDRMVAARLDPG
jgi:N-acetylglucosaminyldiphosphoundecaprenol N-acetyl-beta-D-mannosaminyltransferase